MMEWIKEHPYLAGAAVLVAIIGIIVLRRGGGSSGGIATTIDPNAMLAANVQSQASQNQYQLGVDQLNAALQDAVLQSRTTDYLAQVGASSSQATSTSNNQTQVELAQIAAGTTTAGYKTSEDIAGISANAGVSVAGIQADVVNNETAAALQNQQNIDGAVTAMHSQDFQATVQQDNNQKTEFLAQTAATLKLGQAQTAAALQINQNDNVTALNINNQNVQRDTNIANINAGVQSHVADVTSQVQQLAIATTGNLYSQQIAAQENVDQIDAQTQYEAILAELEAQSKTAQVVTSNFQGLSQTNRAALLATIAGAPQVGQTISSTSNAAGAAETSAWTGVINSIFGAAKTAAGPGGAITKVA